MKCMLGLPIASNVMTRDVEAAVFESLALPLLSLLSLPLLAKGLPPLRHFFKMSSVACKAASAMKWRHVILVALRQPT